MRDSRGICDSFGPRRRVLTILKVIVGIGLAMFVVWGLLYPSSGRHPFGFITPRFAAVAAILVGILMLGFVLWAYMHP